LKPGGKYVAKDLFEAGGIPLVMKALLDAGYLHGDCMTVTGRTVAENLTVYARLYGVRRSAERLATLGRELDIDGFFQRPYGSLSAGQKTRVALAKALLNQPEILLLDEPTASLDPDTADRMRGILTDYQRHSGATLLLASHNMSEVERLCNQVIMLRAGQVVASGAPSELIHRYGRKDMEEVFLDIARGIRSGE
ncbi:MAG TPA: dihydroxy-acid dehydratase, partial [Candidatus Competibacteraceae bacterium]|nr:dihydroxy-acid dehydratase [Candidatus Competibacteraceae bacterium]